MVLLSGLDARPGLRNNLRPLTQGNQNVHITWPGAKVQIILLSIVQQWV